MPVARTAPSSALTPGQYNVYLPQAKKAQYLAFSTLAEAQAAVKAKKAGVILDPAGKLDPSVQKWSGWSSYQAQFPAAKVVLTPGPMPGAAQPGKSTAASVIPVSNSSSTPAATPPADPRSLNGQLKPAATPNSVSVWFPPSYVGALGVERSERFEQGGAYLAFDSVSDAAAHVRARNLGVLLDAQGQFDPTTPQPWPSAGKFGVQRLNAQLTNSRTAHQHGVWIPKDFVELMDLSGTKRFPQGAFLAFSTAVEASAYVESRGFGVVLEPNGDALPNQYWNQSAVFIARRSNDQLTQAPTTGKFNVWFPSETVDGLGLEGEATKFKGGAYLAFDTAAAAQAHTKQRGSGVILRPGGDYDASLQNWVTAPRYEAQRMNPQLKAQRTAHTFNVWFPPSAVTALGLPDSAPYRGAGAYLAFNSAAEAMAHAQARGLGAVLDQQGRFDTSVPQPINLLDPALQTLVNTQLSATRPTDSLSVWFPPDHVKNLGPVGDRTFPQGAYLAFDSAPAAIAHRKARGLGVVLDAKGELVPKQGGSNMSTQFLAEQSNAQLKPTRTPGQVNVWFPGETASSLQAKDASAFAKRGSYLAFDSLKAAQCHVEARGFGVILDAKGDFDLGSQAWAKAGPSGARLLNDQLSAAKPEKGPCVWFPQEVVGQLGAGDPTAYAPGGAFLSFASVKDAKEHATARELGLVFDDKGRYEPSNQVWSHAGEFAPVTALWPPPPLGPEAQRPFQDSAEIVGVYAKATEGGAHFVVRTHNVQLKEQLGYELYLTINGSDMKVKELGTSVMGDSYVHDASFDLSYAEMNALLGMLQGSSVTPGETTFAVKVKWPNGHDQGAAGGGGRGTHRFLAP